MKRYRTAALLTLLCIALAGMARYSYVAVTAVAPTQQIAEGTPTIVIDAGHGNFDGGAVGVGGVTEKEINLAISQNLYELFTINGFDAVLTRQGDESLHSSEFDDSTTRKKKNSDIHNRMEIAKTYPNSLLLSIHQNKFTQEKYWGAQVFYGPQNAQSEQFAQIMQRRLVEMTQPENTRVSKSCGDSVYLIHNAPMPALLIECGFLSNTAESKRLIEPQYQRQLAFAIFAGTMEYLGLEAVPETPSDSLAAPPTA